MWRDVTKVKLFPVGQYDDPLDTRIQRWIDENSKGLTVNYGQGNAEYPPQVEKVTTQLISAWEGYSVLVIVVFGVLVGD